MRLGFWMDDTTQVGLTAAGAKFFETARVAGFETAEKTVVGVLFGGGQRRRR